MPINLMKAIEQREGKPMREILIETYPLYDNQTGVANALGISQPTLSQWISRLGLKEKTVLVPHNGAVIVFGDEVAESKDDYPHDLDLGPTGISRGESTPLGEATP